VDSAFKYLVKWNFIPENFAPKVEVANFIKAQGWDKKPKKK
jgi:hypothetical protein